MMAASGWRPVTLAYTPSWSYAPSPVNEATGPVIWSSKGPTWDRHRHRGRSALRRRSGPCRHPRRGAVSARTGALQCRASRPATRRAHTASALCCPPADARARHRALHRRPDRGRGTSRVAARRLRVVWSGTGRSRPSRRMTEPISPSVCRYARRNTARERQRREDRELRIPGLAAPGGARLGPPGCDRLVGEPDRQAPALAQAGVIGRPVRDLVPLSRNVVAAGLVQLEGQDGHPRSEEGRRPTPPRPQHQPPSRSVHHLFAGASSLAAV